MSSITAFVTSYFEGWTTYTLIAQVLGIGGLLFSVFSFQKNTHKGIMAMQMAAGVFFTANLFMLGAYTGALLNAIAVFRAIVLYNREKEWVKKASHGWLILFCVLFLTVGAVSTFLRWEDKWNGYIALIPAVAMVINTFSFAAKRPMQVRSTILLSSPLWLYYDFINGSVGGYVNETLVILSAVIGLLRYDIPWKRKK